MAFQRCHRSLALPLQAILLAGTCGTASAALDFAARRDVATPIDPSSVVAADFYGSDGALDLAVSFSGSNQVLLYRNDGQGNFSVADSLPAPVPPPVPNRSEVGTGPAGIAAADFNGDGLMDIAGTNLGTDHFFLYLHGTDAPGTWAPSDDDALRGGGSDLTVAQWSSPADTIDDLVIVSETGSVGIALGVGDGTFGGIQLYNRADVGVLTDVEVANFVAIPPLLDVLTVDNSEKQLVVWPADPTFPGQVITADPLVQRLPTMVGATSVTPFEAIVRDWDGDTLPDALVAASEGYLLYYRNGGGALPFGTPPPVVTDLVGPLGTPRLPSTLSAAVHADVDGDGLDDIVVADAGKGNASQGFNWLSVYFGCADSPMPTFDTDGTACGKRPLHHAAADLHFPKASAAAVEDFNGDGAADVLLLNSEAQSFTLFRNLDDGTGKLDAAPSYSAGGRDPFGADSGDLNGDGFEDLVTAVALDATVTYLEGDGAGGFLTGTKLTAPGILTNPRAVTVGSFTQDPALDVLGTFRLDQVLWEGFGDGTFDTAPVAVGGAPGDPRVGNLLGTGAPDLALVSSSLSDLTFWEGDGNGGFTRQAQYPAIYGPVDHLVGPFFSGVRDDVVILGAESQAGGAEHGFYVVEYDTVTSAYLPPSFVRLDAINPVLIGAQLSAIVAGDVDQSGTLDIVGVDSSGRVLVFSNDGARFTFDEFAVQPQLGGGPRSLIVHDLNDDAVLDIALASASSIRLAEGLGGGLFSLAITMLPSNIDNDTLLAVDVDRDGRPDLVASSTHTSDVTVFRNLSESQRFVLRVTRPGGLTTLTWPDQGAGLTYDVVRGDLHALLRVNRDTSDASCLVNDSALPTVTDPQPAPASLPGEPWGAHYYLVRCNGAGCLTADYGEDSEGNTRVVGPAACP